MSRYNEAGWTSFVSSMGRASRLCTGAGPKPGHRLFIRCGIRRAILLVARTGDCGVSGADSKSLSGSIRTVACCPKDNPGEFKLGERGRQHGSARGCVHGSG